MDLDDVLEAWRVNEAVNAELLGLCADDTFEFKPGKGKTIRSNWVHIVGVRRMWIEEKMSRAAEGVPKLDWQTATREEIVAGLALTGSLMGEVFSRRFESTKPVRWKPMTCFAYCIAHEAHHRSQIEIALRLNGREPPDLTLINLWNWSKK